MKKLFSLLAVLLCLSVMVLPVFADLILPPNVLETETVTETAAETTTEAAEVGAALVKTASDASDAGSSGSGQLLVYLVIGVAVLAAAFLLFRQLRKPAK